MEKKKAKPKKGNKEEILKQLIALKKELALKKKKLERCEKLVAEKRKRKCAATAEVQILPSSSTVVTNPQQNCSSEPHAATNSVHGIGNMPVVRHFSNIEETSNNAAKSNCGDPDSSDLYLKDDMTCFFAKVVDDENLSDDDQHIYGSANGISLNSWKDVSDNSSNVAISDCKNSSKKPRSQKSAVKRSASGNPIQETEPKTRSYEDFKEDSIIVPLSDISNTQFSTELKESQVSHIYADETGKPENSDQQAKLLISEIQDSSSNAVKLQSNFPVSLVKETGPSGSRNKIVAIEEDNNSSNKSINLSESANPSVPKQGVLDFMDLRDFDLEETNFESCNITDSFSNNYTAPEGVIDFSVKARKFFTAPQFPPLSAMVAAIETENLKGETTLEPFVRNSFRDDAIAATGDSSVFSCYCDESNACLDLSTKSVSKNLKSNSEWQQPTTLPQSFAYAHSIVDGWSARINGNALDNECSGKVQKRDSQNDPTVGSDFVDISDLNPGHFISLRMLEVTDQKANESGQFKSQEVNQRRKNSSRLKVQSAGKRTNPNQASAMLSSDLVSSEDPKGTSKSKARNIRKGYRKTYSRSPQKAKLVKNGKKRAVPQKKSVAAASNDTNSLSDLSDFSEDERELAERNFLCRVAWESAFTCVECERNGIGRNSAMASTSTMEGGMAFYDNFDAPLNLSCHSRKDSNDPSAEDNSKNDVFREWGLLLDLEESRTLSKAVDHPQVGALNLTVDAKKEDCAPVEVDSVFSHTFQQNSPDNSNSSLSSASSQMECDLPKDDDMELSPNVIRHFQEEDFDNSSEVDAQPSNIESPSWAYLKWIEVSKSLGTLLIPPEEDDCLLSKLECIDNNIPEQIDMIVVAFNHQYFIVLFMDFEVRLYKYQLDRWSHSCLWSCEDRGFHICQGFHVKDSNHFIIGVIYETMTGSLDNRFFQISLSEPIPSGLNAKCRPMVIDSFADIKIYGLHRLAFLMSINHGFSSIYFNEFHPLGQTFTLISRVLNLKPSPLLTLCPVAYNAYFFSHGDRGLSLWKYTNGLCYELYTGHHFSKVCNVIYAIFHGQEWCILFVTEENVNKTVCRLLMVNIYEDVTCEMYSYTIAGTSKTQGTVSDLDIRVVGENVITLHQNRCRVFSLWEGKEVTSIECWEATKVAAAPDLLVVQDAKRSLSVVSI